MAPLGLKNLGQPLTLRTMRYTLKAYRIKENKKEPQSHLHTRKKPRTPSLSSFRGGERQCTAPI